MQTKGNSPPVVSRTLLVFCMGYALGFVVGAALVLIVWRSIT